MNEADKQIDMERLLKRVRPVEPSVELRDRVVGRAKEAWHEPPVETTWRIVVRRLVPSVAAAVLVFSLADVGSNLAVARWRYGRTATVAAEYQHFDEIPGEVYGPFARRLLAARRMRVQDAAALLDYVEQVREILSRIEQDATREPPEPDAGRSRLLIRQVRDFYS